MNSQSQTKKRSMREEMPNTAAFIDALREAFGAEIVNAQVRSGIAGSPTFWASEDGFEIGTRIEHGVRIGLDPITGCSINLDEKGGE